MPDREDVGLVRRILHDVFLLGNPDEEAGALAFGDHFFDVMRREDTLKMANRPITESGIVVTEDDRIGLWLDQA